MEKSTRFSYGHFPSPRLQMVTSLFHHRRGGQQSVGGVNLSSLLAGSLFMKDRQSGQGAYYRQRGLTGKSPEAGESVAYLGSFWYKGPS